MKKNIYSTWPPLSTTPSSGRSKDFGFKILAFLCFLWVSSTIVSRGQSCPSNPGGVGDLTMSSSGHSFLYPGARPSGAESGSVGAHTVGDLGLRSGLLTIKPTIDGTTYGKVWLEIESLSLSGSEYVRVYSGTSTSGQLLLELTAGNARAQVGKRYVFDGSVTIRASGTGELGTFIYRTGDLLFETCANREGIIWRQFVKPNSYVVVDDWFISDYTTYTLPLCIAYFDKDLNYMGSEMSLCIDGDLDAPNPNQGYYFGQISFRLEAQNNYDIDGNGTHNSTDQIKAARITWLIEQAKKKENELNLRAIQLAIWDTQESSASYRFDDGTWARSAQLAVPSLPVPPEPEFLLRLAAGETGSAIAGRETIDIEIPFSWSSARPGQSKTVKLEIPSGVTVTNVSGGTLNGSNLTITGSLARLTLSAANSGSFDIKAVYDDPAYYNVRNLQIYVPCRNTIQRFLHVGTDNLARPFRSITVQWTSDPLPVKLVSFDTRTENNDVVVRWEIAEAVNFSGFELEKSSDGKNWYFLSNIAYQTKKTYQYVDNHSGGITYYRLKLIDRDQTYTYSDIRSIRKDVSATNHLTVYPNPATDNLIINSGDFTGTANLFSLQGKLIKRVAVSRGNQKVFVGDLPQGVFVIQLIGMSGETFHQKFVKK